MKLIEIDAVVAEIEKAIDEPAPSHDQQCPWEDGYYCGLNKAESIIDAIELKEVDLEEEVTNQIRLLNGVHTLYDGKQWWKGTYNELSYFAKYFFELGLKAQSNITVSNIDDVIRESGLEPDSKEAKVFKDAYCVAIDKAFEKFKKGE